MNIAIVGASGALGRATVRAALVAGHQVTGVVRNALVHPAPGASYRFADVVARTGVREALAGAEVVLDVVNSRKPQRLAAGTGAILDAAKELGIRHYVGVSVVGCDAVPVRYYRGKIEQEQLIAASPIGWSLLRATQFHGFVDAMFAKSVLGLHFVATQAFIQPVAVEEVAAALVAAAAMPPQGRLPDFAGPEIMTMGDAFAVWRQARGAGGLLVPLPTVGALGRALGGGGLCNPARAVGRQTFADWLRDQPLRGRVNAPGALDDRRT